VPDICWNFITPPSSVGPVEFDPPPPRFIPAEFIATSLIFLEVRKTHDTMASTTTIATQATPPTTPPIIAGTFKFFIPPPPPASESEEDVWKKVGSMKRDSPCSRVQEPIGVIVEAPRQQLTVILVILSRVLLSK
jgi:hypothetical protein